MAKIVYASNGAIVGDGTRITRVSGGGTKFEVMVDAKTEKFSEVIVVDGVVPVEPVPSNYPALPAGVRKPGDIPRMSADWKTGELVLTTWMGGSGTMGNPTLCEFKDGAAILSARHVNGVWNSGVIQMNRPQKSAGLWQAVLDCPVPEAVCAFFTYGKANELDWELVKNPTGLFWALNVHMPKVGGGRVHLNELGQRGPLIPFKTGVHTYGIELDETSCRFHMDGALVATVRPSDLNNCIWDTTTMQEAFFSVEKHAAWAGHDYVSNRGQMTVYGIGV